MTQRLWIILLALVMAGIALGVSLTGVGSDSGEVGHARDRAKTAFEGVSTPILKGASREGSPEDGADTPPSPVDPLTIDLDRDLHGVVVQEDGTPVAGAHLQIVAYPWRYCDLLTLEGYWRENLGPSTRSATDGTFAIRLPLGEQTHLRVRAPGLAPVEHSMLQAGEFLRVVLREPVRLHVVATSPDGQGAEGLELWLHGGRPGGIELHRTGKTDPTGVCTFEDLPPSLRALLGAEPRTHEWGRPERVSLVLPDKGTLTYELLLPAGRTLRGRVTDALTGEPIADACVGMGFRVEPNARTDPDGRYRLPGWTGEGVRYVHVIANGYARAQSLVGEEDTLDFELDLGVSVKGRVLGHEGSPVEHALVNCTADPIGGLDQPVSMASGTSDENGAFALGGLRSDQQHGITIHATGYARWFGNLPTPQSGVIDLGDVQLGPPCMLLVQLVSSSDEPTARIQVELAQIEPADSMRHYGLRWRRFSDDRGRVRYVDVPPGRYRLQAQPDARQWASVEVGLEDADAPVEVTLPLPTGREVTVEVTDRYGEPVPDCWVHAASKERGKGGVKTQVDARGRALLHLPPCAMVLRVWPGGRNRDRYMPSKPVEVEAAATDARVVLDQAAVTTGRVLDPEDNPVPGALIAVRVGGREVASVRADPLGRFEYKTVPGTVFDLVFTGSARTATSPMPWPQTLPWGEAIVEGVVAGATDVTIRALPPADDRGLTLRVLDPQGRPVPDVTIQLEPASTRPGPLRTGNDGSLRIDGLRAAETEVSLYFNSTRERPWCSPSSQKVVPDGQVIELRLLLGTPIKGVLLDEGGSPAAAGAVLVYVDGKHVSGAEVEEGGSFVAVVDPNESRAVDLLAIEYASGGRAKTAKAENVRPGATGVVLKLEDSE